MNRQKYNLLILKELEDWIEECPDLRFGQILWTSNILYDVSQTDTCVVHDPFFEEPKEIYKRMKKYS